MQPLKVSPPNDEYREFDTLLRFAQVIEAEDIFRRDVRIAMLALLPKIEKLLIQDGAIVSTIPATGHDVSLPEINKPSKQDDATAPPEGCKNNGDKIPTAVKVLNLTNSPPIRKIKKGASKKGTHKKGKQRVYLTQEQGNLKF